MKKILILITVFISITNSIAQTDIKHIRTIFKTVNTNLSNYKKTEIPLNNSTEGGAIISYSDKDKLQKIEVKYFGEMGKKYIDYYFSNDKVVFVFYQDFEYNMPIHLENSKIIKITENRCYLKSSKIFKWLDSDKKEVSKLDFELQDYKIAKSLGKIMRKMHEEEMRQLLKVTIFKILKAFQEDDAITINKLISKETGLYVIFRRGTMDEYLKIDQIDFKNPVPEYLPYSKTSHYNKIEFEKLPTFDCATMTWNKQGLFCDLSTQNSLLSNIAKNRNEYTNEHISYNQINTLKELERHTERIIATNELIFHLTLIKNIWYLTVIDRATSDCSA